MKDLLIFYINRDPTKIVLSYLKKTKHLKQLKKSIKALKRLREDDLRRTTGPCYINNGKWMRLVVSKGYSEML